jgi:hypothetical protein
MAIWLQRKTIMRILSVVTLLLCPAVAAAAPHTARKASVAAPDLLTASSRVIGVRQAHYVQSRYLLPVAEAPEVDQPQGAQFRWKLTKIRLRVPLD